jgi:hypothetical protein
MSMKLRSETESLKHRLATLEENLRLIRERKSEFVQQTDVPLQLVKEERRLEQEIETLRERLAQLPSPGPPPLEEERPVWTRPRAWAIVAGVAGLAFALIIGLKVFPPSPSPTLEPTATPEPPATASLTPSPPVSPTPTIPPLQPVPLRLRLVDERFSGRNVRATTFTASGVLVALDGEGVTRLGGQPLGPKVPGSLLASPLAVTESPDGQLWIGTHGNGLVALTPAGGVAAVYTQTTDGMSIAELNTIALDSEGSVWLGTRTPESGVHALDVDGEWHFYPWGGEEIHSVNDIALDETCIWFATDGDGLHCLDLDTRAWTAVYDQDTCAGKPVCLRDDYVFAIHVTANGRKWVGTARGLCALGAHEDEGVWLGCTEARALPNDRVMALADDGEGHVFVGTVEGLGVVDEDMSAVETQVVGGSLDSYISALAFDHAQRKLWVGTLGDGLSVWALTESSDSAP